MQTASFMIWTLVTDFVSYKDNYFAKSISLTILCYIFIIIKLISQRKVRKKGWINLALIEKQLEHHF